MTRHSPRPTGPSRPLPHHDRLRRATNMRHQMLPDKLLVRAIHAERAARWSAEARMDRLLDRPPRRPIRQAVGRSMIRIGARLAAEPSPGPVRSR